MRQLQELTGCCSLKWVNKILRDEGKEKSLIRLLYTSIDSGKYTEEQIVQKLYGKGTPTSYGPYRTLKTRLRHVLVEAFVLQELKTPTYKTYDLAYQNGYRQLSVVRLLVASKAYHAAREVALHAFKHVRDYEIIPLNHGLTDLISSMYLGLFYNEVLYKKYRDLHRHYSQALFDLSIVSDNYREIRNSIYAQRDAPTTIGQKAGVFIEETLEISEKYPHISQVQGMLVATETTGCMLRGEYLNAIEASSRGSMLLLKCKGVSESVISFLALVRVECTIMLNDFELGRKQIIAARMLVEENVINDLRLTDFAIQLGLRTGNYEFAYREFVAVNQRKINRYLTPRHQEHWIILEACINLLILSGDIKPADDWPKLRRFRAGSFLNKVTTSSRNKKGENIQILIIQALLSIVRKKYDDVFDRTASLDAYCNRYLKDDKNLRNNCFFKLLMITTQCGFNKRKAQRKGEATYKRLQAATDASKLNNTELIPYERLWQIALNHLIVTRSDQIAIEKERARNA